MTRLADACYRLLLRAFPRRTRTAHGDDMARIFAMQRRSLAGRPIALCRLWLDAIADAIRHGLAARRGRAGVSGAVPPPAARPRAGLAGSALSDLRYALRGVRRTPALTAVAVLALALGVGANAAIFSVIHVVMIAPLPYPDGDRVVLLWRQNPSLGSVSLTPLPAHLDAWRGSRSVEGIVAYTGTDLVLEDAGGEPVVLDGARIEPRVLEFTGTRPILGRPFAPEDAAHTSGPRVALLGEDLWTTRFGRDPGVAGRIVTIDDARVEIVGVLPSSFRLPNGRPALVVPLTPAVDASGAPRLMPVSAMGRLASGVSADAAADELSGRLAANGPTPWKARVMTPADLAGQSLQRALIVLAAAVGCVLLIACANIAHLLLARNAARRPELAMRLALGATRGRLMRLLLIEQLVLAAMGGLAGGVVAAIALDALTAWRPPDLRALQFATLGPATLLFVAGLSVAAALAVGVLPAWAAIRGAAAGVGGDGPRTIGQARVRRVRAALSVAEIALALVLLTTAGVLIRTYVRTMQADPGYSRDGLISLSIDLPASRYSSAGMRRDFFERLAAALRAIPGVRRHAFAATVPPDSGLYFGQVAVEGAPPADGPTQFEGGPVQPAFFEILRIPVIDGRTFVPADVAPNAPPVAVLSAAAARSYWPDGPAVGRRLRIDAHGPWRTVVGVVGDIDSSLRGAPAVQLYEPLTTMSSWQSAVIETTGDTDVVLAAIRDQVRGIDPRLPVARLETLDDAFARINVRPRFQALLLSLIAGIGLVLAASGVYGVINYSVAVRTRELGVRIALGATPRSLGGSVLREAAVVAAAGIAAGLLCWLFAGQLLATLLTDLAPAGPATLSAVAAILLATTVVAAWLPARRAFRTDPVGALKCT